MATFASATDFAAGAAPDTMLAPVDNANGAPTVRMDVVRTNLRRLKTRFLQAIASQVGPEVLFGRCALTILRARGLRAADPTRRSDFIEESLIPQHGGG